MNNETRSKPDCCSAEDFVALMYDELSPAVRTGIEDHLAVCDPCTSEFADLSLARLSVYEWNRDEFAVMKTPLIEIPIATEPAASWLDPLRAIFASPMRWASAGVSFAAVLAVMAFWAYMPANDEFAGVDVPPSVIETGPVVIETGEPSAEEPSSENGAFREDMVTVSERPASTRKPRSKTSRPAQAVVNRSRTPSRTVQDQRTSAPRLVEFEDEDDVTLRLGELLADVDTRK
ncbi:MAG: hypothetical protein IPM25_02985 [Chloracidobacterium sp.]|nr:hypothetical protein [Chloracidobacterium sp.]